MLPIVVNLDVWVDGTVFLWGLGDLFFLGGEGGG
jgi:hypothetical protein